jgi:F0F1-type ATP synthase membrane subunit c/vacuolar-type H+-ATPase subunit K
MDINVVLCVTVVAMAFIGFAITKLGSEFFNAVSRNPVIGEKMTTMALVLAAMIELFGLIMVLISLYIVFVK